MANYEATRYNFDGSDLTGIQGVNTGLIIPWCATSVPSGFLECDGSNVSRSTYSALFAVIGTTYGSGDGSSTFGLPNLSDKIVKGLSPSTNLGTAVNNNTVATSGNIGGSLANTTITVPTLASHNHPGPGSGGTTGSMEMGSGGGGGGSGGGASSSVGGDGAHSHNLSCTFTGDAASVVQPINITKYIIKT